ncbi:ExbD/TolR family protein [Gynurincola endophyticus]|jgi:biopolymer transport protein ExbD|uniref:ExbD/TolR family protein n=1 Tax=Gynurincola endophyticus TaxID=2479004 RepID=UPI000F8EB2AC|nr:biopolymer transporter ExbD [Gynurincola endophyticus]
MNLRKRLKGHSEMQAGALNDILFILLFFFLIVSTLANPNVIKLAQPKAKSDTKVNQTVVVNIKTAGEFIINGKALPAAELKAFMEPLVLKDTTQVATIAINADKTIPIEEVVNVMKVARDLGARSVLMVDKTGQQ